MKNTYKSLNIISLLTVIIFAFIACDEDFTTLESDININDNFSTDVAKYAVKAYTKKINRVQTNNLPINLLGVYNDPVYGKTTASFVSQLSPSSSNFNPVFGENIELDSVILNIPYFSTLTDTDSDGNFIYKLDSIYGDSPIELSIYRNKYFLRNFSIIDNDSDESLTYFSDGTTSENVQINETIDIQGDLLYENTNFKPSSNQIVLKDLDENITKLIPGFRLRLDDPDTNIWQSNDYWKTNILDKEGEIELSNQNNFIDYFRGLYFKTGSIDDLGNLIALDFGSNANLTIHYTSTTSDTESGEDIEEQKTYQLNFFGNNINFLSNSGLTVVDGDSDNGDQTLYVKGGEGSFAVIDLFDLLDFDDDPDTDNTFEAFKKDFVEVKDEFSGAFKKSKRLINEAYLKFYVNQTIVQGQEPSRVYLYDLKNNSPIIDYFLDQTFDKDSHLEPLKRENNEPTGNGISYKIRITEHINNILLRDSTNLKLGLVVSNNVLLEGTRGIDFDINISDDELNVTPTSSIVTPEGTVLYGSHSNVPETSRVQLEIYYTEPDSN